MSDFKDDDVTAATAGHAQPRDDSDPDDGMNDDELVEDIADDVRTDILLGHVEDDVSTVLEERLEEVGLHMPPEEIDGLADEIENDVSS